MTYEEWKEMTEIALKFYGLSTEQQHQIMLMIDGLRYRNERKKNNVGALREVLDRTAKELDTLKGGG